MFCGSLISKHVKIIQSAAAICATQHIINAS
jgi:hypothetical protein